MIPFPSHTVSWPVYTVPTEKGNGCNCDSAQRSRKKKTFGVNADDLKKKKLLNKKSQTTKILIPTVERWKVKKSKVKYTINNNKQY